MVCEIIGYYGILNITIAIQGLSAGQDLQTYSSLQLCDSKPIICNNHETKNVYVIKRFRAFISVSKKPMDIS